MRPGHRPKNRPLLQVSPRGGTFETDLDGKVPEAVVVRRDLLFSLAEVSCLTRPTACRRVAGLCTGFDWIPVSSFHFLLFDIRSLALTDVFSWYFRDCSSLFPSQSDLSHCGGLSTSVPLSGRLFSLGVCHFQEQSCLNSLVSSSRCGVPIARWWPTTSWI